MLLSHVFLMIESLGGCRAVRLYYPALTGHESTLRVFAGTTICKSGNTYSQKFIWDSTTKHLTPPTPTPKTNKQTNYFFFLKDCSFVQLQTLMAWARVSTSPLPALSYSDLGKQGSCSLKFVFVTLSVRSKEKKKSC